MNLLLVDSTVKDYEVFVNSVNATTTPVVYFPHTTRQELLAALHGPIERIAVVSHTHTFIEREPIFSDLNVELFKNIIETHQVKHIDYLACNTLQNPEWTEYFKKIPCVIGASNDLTGNIKYGGDWVMESTSEDIESIYFTQSIEYYKYFLSNFTDTNGIQYTINGSTVSVSGVNNGISELVIPSSITIDSVTYTVTSIDNLAFYQKEVTSVTIPNSVTYIGNSAFMRCSLFILTIDDGPNDVIIDDNAFKETRLKSVTIPNSVTTIGSAAFRFTPLDTLTILDGVKRVEIRGGAFGFTNLKTVTMPRSISYMGEYVFGNFPSKFLSSALISSSTELHIRTFDSSTRKALYSVGYDAITSVSLTDLPIYDLSNLSITSIGTVFSSPSWTTISTVFIPTNATYSGLSSSITLYKKAIVRNITYTLLYDNTLYSVSPTESTSYDLSSLPITSIGAVFQGKPLSSITFPLTLTTIENNAFRNTGLTSVTIPASVTSVGDYAFSECQLTKVTIQ